MPSNSSSAVIRGGVVYVERQPTLRFSHNAAAFCFMIKLGWRCEAQRQQVYLMRKAA